MKDQAKAEQHALEAAPPHLQKQIAEQERQQAVPITDNSRYLFTTDGRPINLEGRDSVLTSEVLEVRSGNFKN